MVAPAARTSKKKSASEPDAAGVSPAANERAAAPRRFRRLAALLVVPLAALVWFAPALVAMTSLRQQIVPALAPELPGHATLGAASLGWTSSVVLHDLWFYDEEGRPWLHIPRLTTERSLAGFLGDRSRIGRVRIEQPQLAIRVRPGGSNVEDVIAGYLERAADSSGGLPFILEIIDGQVAWQSEAGEQAGTLQAISGTIAQSDDAHATPSIALNGTAEAGGHLGRFEIATLPVADSMGEGSTDGLESRPTVVVDTLDVSARFDNLPLEPFSPLLERFAAAGRLAGMVHGETRLRVRAVETGFDVSAGGRLDVRQFELVAPQWIGKDRFRAQFVALAGGVDVAGEQITLERLQIDSDLGNVGLDGRLLWSDIDAGLANLRTLGRLLRRDPLDVQARIDLARLAAVLPGTLHVRAGTEITGGTLELELSSREKAGRRTIDGRLEASGLTAEQNGTRLHWDRPVRMTLRAGETDAGFVVDELRCESEFLQLAGKGRLDDATLTVQADLDRLVAELGQFIDLSQIELSGTLAAELKSRRPTQETVSVRGSADVQRFELVVPGRTPWREERLNLTVAADGATADGGWQRLETAALGLQSGADRFEMATRAPIVLDERATIPVDLKLSGQLPTWWARLEPWLGLEGWTADGRVRLTARAELSRDTVAIDAAEADFESLGITGQGVFIRESQARLTGSGRWDSIERRFVSDLITWASPALSLRAERVAVAVGEKGAPQTSGHVTFRGGLGPLSDWLRDTGRPPVYRVAGQAAGQLSLSHEAGTTTAGGELVVRDFSLATATAPAPGALRALSPGTSGPTWSERELTVTVEARYNGPHDMLRLDRCEVASQALRLATSGTVRDLSTRPAVELEGELGYDLEQLLVLVRPQVGDGVKVTGQGSQPFSLRGPLLAADQSMTLATGAQPVRQAWPLELTGRAGLSWDSANVYGFVAGPGVLNMQLQQGVLQVEPLDVTVSEGRVKAAPRLLLTSSPLFVALDKGPLIEKVRFSPEMCQNWLKYVAPLLADATEIDGRFSVDLSGGMIPVLDPRRGDLAGTLAVHSANVNPGPLADQFITLANQLKSVLRRQAGSVAVRPDEALMTMPAQNVEFWMAQGRVHHRRLEFFIDDTLVRTAGSVGLDKSLALTAEVPIRDEWIGSDRYLAGLKGQVLTIPVGGTLDRPQIDQRALTDLARRLAGGAARGLIQDEVSKQLEKLFQRGK